jgi:integrase
MLRETRGAKGRAAWVVNVPPNLSPTGRRQELFFASRTEAKTECEKLKARKDNFGVSLTAMTAARVAEAAECYKLLDLAADKRSLLEIVRAGLDLEQKRTASIPFGRLFQEYCDSRPAKTSTKHTRSLRYTPERFATLNDRLACDIGPQEIADILKKRPAAATNMDLRHLRSVFTYGQKHGWLVGNPAAKVDFIDIERREVEIFSPGQTEVLLKYAFENDPALLPFLLFGFFCGIRPDGEIQKLEWQHIHLTGKPEIEVPPAASKTRRRRFCDIAPNALAWIEAYQNRGGPMEGKLLPISDSTLTRKRAAALQATGVEWLQSGMRHTFCSAWLAMHHDVNKLVLMSGHDDPDTMWKFYHRGTSGAEAGKFWNILPPKEDGKIIRLTA